MSRYMTRESRDGFAQRLKDLAAENANGSRDFGRGYQHAIKMLESVPAQCDCCPTPRGDGDRWTCPLCGAVWWTYPHGASWISGPEGAP